MIKITKSNKTINEKRKIVTMKKKTLVIIIKNNFIIVFFFYFPMTFLGHHICAYIISEKITNITWYSIK